MSRTAPCFLFSLATDSVPTVVLICSYRCCSFVSARVSVPFTAFSKRSSTPRNLPQIADTAHERPFPAREQTRLAERHLQLQELLGVGACIALITRCARPNRCLHQFTQEYSRGQFGLHPELSALCIKIVCDLHHPMIQFVVSGILS